MATNKIQIRNSATGFLIFGKTKRKKSTANSKKSSKFVPELCAENLFFQHI
jgi:hypothetical protein